MRPSPAKLLPCALVAMMACLGPPDPARADQPALVLTTLQPADPCSFYRAQAFGKGLAHFATELLWACEAIALRRAADMTLGDRLQAVALAMDRYRAELLAEGQAQFRASRSAEPRPGTHGLDDKTKHALAEGSGLLAALAAVRTGF